MSDLDLYSLFDKLTECLGERTPWNLRRTPGKIGMVWQVAARFDGTDLAAENGHPELAVRAFLGLVLERVQAKANGIEDSARIARDEAARLQRVMDR